MTKILDRLHRNGITWIEKRKCGPFGVRNTFNIVSPNGAVTGMTGIDRAPVLFEQVLKLLQVLRPEQQKKIGSFPSSIGAEAMGLAARIKAMGKLSEYQVDCVDINPEFITASRSFEMPGSMLDNRPRWFKSSFEKAEDADWVKLKDEIASIVKIHDPANLKSFKSEDSYDLVFMLWLMLHLEPEEQEAVLENIISLSSGLICLTQLAYENEPDDRRAAEMRAQRVLKDHGFQFLYHADGDLYLAERLERQEGCNGAYIAIHPDMAEELQAIAA